MRKRRRKNKYRVRNFGKNLSAFVGMYLSLFLLTLAGCVICILTTGGF